MRVPGSPRSRPSSVGFVEPMEAISRSRNVTRIVSPRPVALRQIHPATPISEPACEKGSLFKIETVIVVPSFRTWAKSRPSARIVRSARTRTDEDSGPDICANTDRPVHDPGGVIGVGSGCCRYLDAEVFECVSDLCASARELVVKAGCQIGPRRRFHRCICHFLLLCEALCVFLVTGKDTCCVLFVKYLSMMCIKKWLLINGIHLCFAAYLWIRVRLFPVHRVSCPGSRAARQLPSGIGPGPSGSSTQ
jgi:hypothetical protein